MSARNQKKSSASQSKPSAYRLHRVNAGVAQPAVAVVPVALAVRHLGQRRGGRGDHGAARRERQALQGQRAALQVPAPRMVREAAPGQPVLPVVRGPHQPALRLLVAERRLVHGPGQRDEVVLAFPHQGPGHGPAALETDPHVGGQGQPDPGLRAGRPAHRLGVAAVGVLPGALQAAVVEDRLAVEGDLHLAGDAADGAQQHMVGVVVGRRPAVRVGQLDVVMPRPHQQRVAHHQPPGGRPPAGLQHHRAGQVAAGRGHVDPFRAEPEPAGRAVQHRAEHARRVQPGQAHPLHVAARRDQRGGLAVGQEAVLADRRERGLVGDHVHGPRSRRVQAIPPLPGHVPPTALGESIHPLDIPRQQAAGGRYRHSGRPLRTIANTATLVPTRPRIDAR